MLKSISCMSSHTICNVFVILFFINSCSLQMISKLFLLLWDNIEWKKSESPLLSVHSAHFASIMEDCIYFHRGKMWANGFM